MVREGSGGFRDQGSAGWGTSGDFLQCTPLATHWPACKFTPTLLEPLVAMAPSHSDVLPGWRAMEQPQRQSPAMGLKGPLDLVAPGRQQLQGCKGLPQP